MGEESIQYLLNRLSQYLSEESLARVEKAFHLAQQAHGTQRRKSGELFIQHPVAVAQILADLNMDEYAVTAALLHDTLEDTALTKEEIELQLGPVVAHLVDGVSKLDHIASSGSIAFQAENVRKMILAMAKDIRVIVIKLADRLHNMRTISALNREKQEKKAKETLEIYVPLASRLGMFHLKTELQDRSFEVLYPYRYATLSKAIHQHLTEKASALQNVITILKKAFAQAQIHTVNLSPLISSPFSVYSLVKNKKYRIHQALERLRINVTVQDVDACYRILGLVHHCYKPQSHLFKDYIAVPKANGYQALHTTVVGVEGLVLDIQIRTEFMDRVAQQGIAAHWLYHPAPSHQQAYEHAQKQAEPWVQELVELRQHVDTYEEYLRQLKKDLNPKQIYVFTPQGKIINLPEGSVALDFAYALHTDVGHHCKAAYVNQQPFPLNRPLKNGQTIEIITDPAASPQFHWLDIVRSSRARSSIKNWYKKQALEKQMKLGESWIRRLLSGTSLNYQDEKIQRLLSLWFGVSDFPTLVLKVGTGNITVTEVEKVLKEQAITVNPAFAWDIDPEYFEYAPCCLPIPGDRVQAITSGKGVMIHRSFCKKFKQHSHYVLQEFNLIDRKKSPSFFTVEVMVLIQNLEEALSSVLKTCEEDSVQLIRLNQDIRNTTRCELQVMLQVTHRTHLAQWMRHLRRKPGIYTIHRI